MALEPPDLLAHRAPHRRVAGMQPRHLEPGVMGCDEFSGDSVEVERGSVNHPRAGRAERDDLARHQRSCEQAHRTARHQILAAHGDQIGRAGAGANEMDGHAAVSSMMAAAAVAWRSADTMRVTTRRAPAPAAARAAASQTLPTPRCFFTWSERVAKCASAARIALAATVSIGRCAACAAVSRPA